MNFGFYLGTRVVFGQGCILKNPQELVKYGKRAFIVTGKSSGSRSGALADILKLLSENSIESYIYDCVENNPSIERVADGGCKAAEFKADFVIGIGGGSPLDASKAIAVLAVNRMDPLELYENNFAVKPLPIIAIPTTAGTGSEVTQYSILTRNDIKYKRSFGNADTFPRVAFLDPEYTMKLPLDITVNTAVDALSHAVEGYLSKRNTPVSDILAEESIRIFGENKEYLLRGEFDINIREKLLYMSMLAGIVIAHTGTTLVHAIGYALTYFKDIPHGKANGFFMGPYLDYNYQACPSRIDKVLTLLGLKDINEFSFLMSQLMGQPPVLSEEEYKQYSEMAAAQRNVLTNPRPASALEVYQLMKTSLG